jgi:tetratricopeptide (TPR) repeat protein/Cdc6-like AAA superfamily ATPase
MTGAPTRILVVALLLLLLAPPVRAVDEWYDFYLQARDRDIPAERWEACVTNLEEALRLRPQPGNNVQTYGLQFLDYLPHYYMGLCLLRQKKYDEAARAFDRSEKAGAVTRSRRRADLSGLRSEIQSAEAAEAARLTRLAREEAESKLREARELGRRREWDEALARLVEAESLAQDIDPELLQTITRERERIRRAQTEQRETTQRRERIQQRLADGDRLLAEGQWTEATVAYDEVLDLDPGNARAREGKETAEERIQASQTRAEVQARYEQGRALFDAGRYEEAVGPLTEASAGGHAEAAELLERTNQIREGLRLQREERLEIERLFTRGEQLMKEGRFPEAQVAFESLLQLDPGHARAAERLAIAQRRTGEALFAKWLPNRQPEVVLYEREGPVVDTPTLALQGVATDDRAVSRLDFLVGGELVDEIVFEDDPVTPARVRGFVKVLPLTPGRNEITVILTDSGGLTDSLSIFVERRLRFYETPLFLPSAGAVAVGLLGLGWVAQRVRRRRAMRRRFNPYIAGAPVLDPDMFYGREKLTARMLSTLHRNSLMITGERRIGKTTFLHHLSKVLAADEGGEWQFFPVFVDLQGVPEQTFFHAVMAEIVDALDLSPETREALRLRPEPDGYEARDFSHDLKEVIEELKSRTSRRVKLALLLDEVDVLNEYSESVNQRLRGIFMKSFSENLVAVMSGVGIRRRWKSEVSPWYNFFDEIELSPFSREEAEALIREPVAGVFRWKAEAVERILELSRLRPYLVQKYCVHALNHMLEENRSTARLDDVESARLIVEAETAAGEPNLESAGAGPVAD